MRKTSDSARNSASMLVLLALWVALYFGARYFLDANPELAPGVRLAVGLAPMPAFAAFLWSFIRRLRAADEFERRIQLEALAVAFPLGLLLLTTLALMQRAVALSMQDWSYAHIWPYFVLFYVVGVVVARKRYS